jgi:hypothetical protein
MPSAGAGKLPKSLREQLRVVFAHQLRIAWVTYVHEMLGGSTMTAKRRRDLVLQLPVGTLTPINGIPQLTPDLATHYAGKTRKTITRDVNVLAKRGLVFHTTEGVQPNLELMQAFLPVVQPSGAIRRRRSRKGRITPGVKSPRSCPGLGGSLCTARRCPPFRR